MTRARNVKILATLGPASNTREKIAELCRAGADVFRINMSHSSHEMLNDYVTMIRDVEADVGHPIGILVDLQGPKLRVATFADDAVELEDGATFVLDSDPTPGDVNRVHLPHPEILSALKAGDRLLLDDGRLKLIVEDCDGASCTTKVVNGGKLSNRKGVSVPDTTIDFGALTPKDRADLDAAVAANVDWIALSFVQRAEDIAELRKLVRGRAGCLSKIEKPQALEALNEIIELSDALMVARGDLGVEMPLEQVPGLQKRITRACRRAGKPVVVATQMLESMITSPVPTRAEVSDVATAVFEGADAVMLSAESAAGDFPVEAVSTMNKIAEEVERDPVYPDLLRGQRTEPEATGADAIAAAARQIAETLRLSSVVCYTSSGATALRVARERPSNPIIALSPVVETARRLALIWGLRCVVSEDAQHEADMVDKASRISFRMGLARPGQRIIIVAGVPFGTPGSTNMLRIAFVGSDGSSGI
ncbi:pyruvate kinase [Rhodobium orientis]|uniref:Pyruvate kinase n=1 Tax=Rhodobium orientis TaxID=34017 RepID=A0A327JFU4_9HYPH|nr:pyruvate kinase [Rhodobium orientis]MBB4305657.1 pyruvate kinase [Rhodobium orientis]MBK5949169.1 pyruvate kinase [Rhodobium orientis]RAI24801.1 pyruvate kinase [Rhodobium orientis]